MFDLTLHPRLRALGWNERVLTYDDFRAATSDVLVIEVSMPWQGVYLERKGVPVICLNEDLTPPLQSLVAWHELGHHWLHCPGACFFSEANLSKAEFEANTIAAVAVLPRSLLKTHTVGEIQEEFGCSPGLIAFRVMLFELYGL